MKIILLVINGFGIGELNDASVYGDSGANSYRAVKDAELPVLRLLGLDNIFNLGYSEVKTPQGAYGRMRSLSFGKNPYIQYRELLGNINYDSMLAGNPLTCPSSENIIGRLAKSDIKTKIFGSAAIYSGADKIGSSADILYANDDEQVCEEAVKSLMLDMDNAFYIVSFDSAVQAGKARSLKGYKQALEKIDVHVGHIIDAMYDDDVIIICSDSGCDCLLENHCDYTREYVPLLISGRIINKNNEIKTIHGYDIVAHTILDLFGILTTHKSIKQNIIAQENQPQLLSRIKKLVRGTRNNS